MVSEEMDSDHHSSIPRFLPYHIKIMKVALAVAIIRQKTRGGVCQAVHGATGPPVQPTAAGLEGE
ncbi:hypothetical protein GBAR_LOCUS8760, partial [Geodia barretti]